MAGEKTIKLLDKRDLECAICLERFTEPKTLECLHSYCLSCLQSLIKTSGKIKCPKCCTVHDNINQHDLKNVNTNKMLINQVKYVEKIESGKPQKCQSCDAQPGYCCSVCKIYQCGQCVQQHKLISSLSGHSLYKLEDNDLPINKCKIHGASCMLEFFCQTCSKCGCKKCEHVVRCYKNKHKVIPFTTAAEKFNQNAIEVKKTIEGIKKVLKRTLSTISEDKAEMESEFKLCRTAIELEEEKIIKKVQEETRALITDLEKTYKENKDVVDSRVQNIDSTLITVNEVSLLLIAMMNKPEERQTLKSHKAHINSVNKEVLEQNVDKSIFQSMITPSFIPSKNLENVINLEGIGKMYECMPEVVEDDTCITVTTGQLFAVKVSNVAESKTSLLSATLIDISGKESTAYVEQGSGKYNILGRCHNEGEWKMMITSRAQQIHGSPVNIKVEAPGLVHTIGNIKTHKNKHVTDVLLDKNGCIIVSSGSRDLLKFNQAYSFIGRITVHHADVAFMHQMDDGHIVCSDFLNRAVVMCDDQFQNIRTFGKGILKNLSGLTVNMKTRSMYVADWKCHSVFKFNIDNGQLIGTIGSEGDKKGQMNSPEGVTLTNEGNLIVADCRNNRIQMFDANDKFMRILVDSGKKDGHVHYPHYVTIDSEENMLVSSNNKLQVFDKYGAFIKRIDNGELTSPLGIEIISYKPRRVAVSNLGTNNVNIYNY
ncbi:tripartite motif-containing protein 2-like [Antedon mediterranea]|uniref:tripartite motif-containing protein 2-like n=1 Tax=Antedon mediterranea TaxID=105859 RepID=UPI003AF5EF3F